MGLFRLLFWIALIAAAFWLWRRLTGRRRLPRSSGADGPLRSMRRARAADQALQAHDRWYCSQAHLRQVWWALRTSPSSATGGASPALYRLTIASLAWCC